MFAADAADVTFYSRLEQSQASGEAAIYDKRTTNDFVLQSLLSELPRWQKDEVALTNPGCCPQRAYGRWPFRGNQSPRFMPH